MSLIVEIVMAGFLLQCLMNRWWVVALVVAPALTVVVSEPQINLLSRGCSFTGVSDMFSKLNATFADLRSQLSDQNKRFATAQQDKTSEPIFAMAQCRDYLSTADCLACFDAAVKGIRNCSGFDGGRVIYDGCFLRYESVTFYVDGTAQGNGRICGNNTASQSTAFQKAVQGLLTDLAVATPRVTDFFAAAKKEIIVGANETLYSVAQCAETVSKSVCHDCLNVAYKNIMTCPPETDGRAYDAGCFLRYSNKAFFADNYTTDISPFLPQGASSKKKAIIISATVGGGGGILIIFMAFLWYRRSRKPKADERANLSEASEPRAPTLYSHKDLKSATKSFSEENKLIVFALASAKLSKASELRAPTLYSYKDLKSATRSFSEENKLGEGGFGEVYKGTMKNGNIVAVKRMALATSRAKSDFAIEVKLISNVHHRNLLRLLGCSYKGPELLLVYDYMPNGSLDKFLYGKRRGTLNWKQRFDIIFGTARGLAYLHEQFHVCIIHRDIKSSNILLDQNFQPKIADFGLAKLLPGDRSHLSTKFAGTLGYTAPEYAIYGQLSEKVDTYSFGVVVLEIISGRRCNDIKDDPVTEYLLERAWKLYENDLHLQLVDESLDPNEYRVEDVKKVIEIALTCTQSPASTRPTMSEVVISLASEGTLGMRRPTRPNPTGLPISNATVSFSEFTGL